MNSKISQSERISPLKRRYATVRLTRINIRSAGGFPPRRVHPESGARLVGPERIVRFTSAALEPSAPTGHIALDRPTPEPLAESSALFGGRIMSFPLATRTAVRRQRKREDEIFEARRTSIES